MPFDARLGQTGKAIALIEKYIWNAPTFANRITVVPFGYEHTVQDAVRQKLISMRNPTAKYIRFAPDYFLIDQGKIDREAFIYLFDYKTTQTPIYSLNRIAAIARDANIPNLTSEDIGQMETDAYNNYSAIQRLGVRVAVLNYCAYHPRLLLCDFVERIKVLRQDVVTTQTITGSRTPFTNFYCRSMRTLEEFLMQEHDIQVEAKAYAELLTELQKELPITHALASPEHPSKQQRQ